MDAFNNLPTPAKAGIALAGGAGLMGTIALLFGGNTTMLLIIAMGIVVVGAMLVAYKFVLGWLGKRKAAPLERGILNNSAASPNSISEPARRARLDDLRRSFEGGVEKFKASGKNIYSLPWYALVGEPGSGKTEAIRHCNVGFPPGLQDQLQGAGGTLNMNWWFTNHAIILDTAGRLMFEEVEPGGTSEWKEFLTLLTKVRPNCPINGMLLVIPADSLIRDTADAIERKAGKIAQQLDSIQRLLGVRFPVFIVVTKADLINGFREFFDTLSDPQLQHQIMGWSNPAPLDQPFSPEAVEKHLQTVATSLSKRRQGLLIDPVNTDDPNGRRVDQVDALYAFPESLLKIGPRLRRYLEMVFVAGEWSPKPLFLRGIYFTSSMREGSALDAELAEALKVPIESLPEGKVWERDRAYFLRDLFLQKVFKEKGLVTRASDTKKLQRHRKLAVMATCIVGVVVLMGLTFFGARTLDRRIGEQREYWSAASSEYADSTDKWALIDTKSTPAKYLGDSEIRAASGKIPRAKFHSDSYGIIQNRIDVPWIFKPLSAFSGEINQKRSTAYRTMFEASVLQPLIKASRDKMATESAKTWNERTTAALAQLVRIETYAANGTPASTPEAPINLDPLARYVLVKDEEYNSFKAKHAKGLTDLVEYLYTNKDGGGKWVPAAIGSNTAVVGSGVRAFNEYWSVQAAGQSERLATVSALLDALRRFKEAEVALGSASKNATENLDQFKSFTENWGKGFTDLNKGKGDADAAIASLSKGDGWPEGKTLASVVETEVGNISREALRAYQSVIAHLPADDKSAAATPLSKVRGDLKDAQAQISTKIASLTNDPTRSKTIIELDAFYLAKGKDLQKAQSRRYVIHHQVYSRADQQIKSEVGQAKPTFSTIAGDLKKLDSDMDSAIVNDVQALPSAFTSEQQTIADACATALRTADLAAREKRYRLIKLTLNNAPQSLDQVAAAIAKNVSAPLAYGKVPLTSYAAGGKFAVEYHPEAAGAYLSGWKALSDRLDPKTAKTNAKALNTDELSSEYEKTRKPIEDYVRRYAAYWTNDLRSSLAVGAFTSWSQLFKDDLAGNQWEVKALSNIQDIDEKARAAIKAVQDVRLPAPLDKGLDSLPELGKTQLGQIEQRYIRIVNTWRSLGEDPETARTRVLGNTAEDFLSAHIAPADDAAPLAEKYINQFSFELLKALANEANKTASQAFADLKELSHFPLALYRPGKNDKILTPDDVIRARGLYRKVIVPARNLGVAQQPKISDGGRTRDPQVNKQLEMLCGLALNDTDREFMEQTSALLAALPLDPTKPSKCTVSPVDQAFQNSYSREAGKEEKPYLSWPVATICQDSRPQNRAFMDKDKATETLGVVSYPGRPIEFRVVSHPSNQFELTAVPRPFVYPPNNQATFGGEWGAVFLINQPNSRRSADGREWHVEIPIDAKTSLWVKLEFDKDLAGFPELKKWPQK